jgi:hypothetical protein
MTLILVIVNNNLFQGSVVVAGWKWQAASPFAFGISQCLVDFNKKN